MTPSRLATATLLFAGLALPALAQGTATTPAATTAATVPAAGSTASATPAARAATAAPMATPSATSAAHEDGTARAMPSATQAGKTGVPEARPHADATPVPGLARSHRRLASASRPDRAGVTHTTSSEVAPVTTR